MITDRDRRFAEIAFASAKCVESIAGARIAAIIVYKNRIKAFGFNQRKTHPFQAEYSRRHDAIYLHAEVDTIKNFLRECDVDDLAKCTLYVVRAKYSDDAKSRMIMGMAKPCSGCRRAISTFKIGRVVYSTDDQKLIEAHY